MKKFLYLCFCFLSCFSYIYASDGKPLKIAVISDVHYLSSALAEEGTALAAYEASTGRNIRDLHGVFDHVMDDLKKERPDLLFIPGDITNNGERQSHIDFIEAILPLQQQGTRILIVPGNHDINIPAAKAYRGEEMVPTETISVLDFTSLYHVFGYDDALSRDTVSLSYLTALNNHLWLLCLDANRYDENRTSSITAGRIRPQTMEWALKILEEAKERGITVLGMMHHGLVEHLPYQSTFFPDYLVEHWRENAALFADAGLKVIFTGHFHANDVTMFTSNSGNSLYDVETASLAQYPFAYRIMLLTDHKLSIDTRFVTSIPGKPDLENEYREKMEQIALRTARNFLQRVQMPLTEEAKTVLTDLMVKLSFLHVRGDEVSDVETEQAIRSFAELLDNSAEIGEFAFDFPPADNRLEIVF